MTGEISSTPENAHFPPRCPQGPDTEFVAKREPPHYLTYHTRTKSLETVVRYHTHSIHLDYDIDVNGVIGTGYSGPVLMAKLLWNIGVIFFFWPTLLRSVIWVMMPHTVNFFLVARNC